MGVLNVIGGAGAALLGAAVADKKQPVAPPPQPIHVTPEQHSTDNSQRTNNNTVSQAPNQQQTANNTSTQNVGGINIETNIYVGNQDKIETEVKKPTVFNTPVHQQPHQSQTSSIDQKPVNQQSSSSELVKKTNHDIHTTNPLQKYTSYASSSNLKKALPFALVAVGGAIVLLFNELRSMEKYLYKKKKLFNWNRDISTQELETMDKDTVGPVLVAFVQKRYTVINTFDNFTTPVTAFLNELTKEERTLKRYLTIANILRKLHINDLLGAHDVHIKYAKDCLTRLGIMKMIVESWNAAMRAESIGG